LNTAIVERLRAADKEDSTVNALVQVDNLAMLLTPGLEESLKSLDHLIKPFFAAHRS
jgi:hypothetical protein